MHFAPWWSIFPVKNRFSHIFPVPGGLPFLTVILTVKLARLLLDPASLLSFIKIMLQFGPFVSLAVFGVGVQGLGYTNRNILALPLGMARAHDAPTPLQSRLLCSAWS